ncbi:MAG: hypothetical protein H7232_14985, partial [Aeromicrobium sp.]|nr:hypothetical protein [Burkholderiales bacterium]
RADGAAVTPYAARKWLKGDSIPTQEKVHILARWLGVSASWLRFGEEKENLRSDVTIVAGPSTADINLLRDFNLLSDDERRLVLDFVKLLGERHRLKENET